jgi:Ner family transcriptional regulator
VSEKTGWDPQDILFAVRKKGSNLQRLGLEKGFFRHTLHKSLTTRFPRAHRVIADFLDVPRQSIWPQFYDENDAPRSFRQVRSELARSQRAA